VCKFQVVKDIQTHTQKVKKQQKRLCIIIKVEAIVSDILEIRNMEWI